MKHPLHSLMLIFIIAIITVGIFLQFPVPVAAGKPGVPTNTPRPTGLLPDLRTVVPVHLNLVNQQQRTILRFTNGIANTGDGPWQLRPVTAGTSTTAYQDILDANGNVVETFAASVYEYHPSHNHWHVGDAALYEVRAGSPTGPVVGINSIKVGYCLIDWYTLEGNANTKSRGYWDCHNGMQGASVGWVDQYHHSTDGQQLDLTGVPSGHYYLISISNPFGKFKEKNYTNNSAWTSFQLTNDNKGNVKIVVTGNSPCESPGMCGLQAPNR